MDRVMIQTIEAALQDRIKEVNRLIAFWERQSGDGDPYAGNWIKYNQHLLEESERALAEMDRIRDTLA